MNKVLLLLIILFPAVSYSEAEIFNCHYNEIFEGLESDDFNFRYQIDFDKQEAFFIADNKAKEKLTWLSDKDESFHILLFSEPNYVSITTINQGYGIHTFKLTSHINVNGHTSVASFNAICEKTKNVDSN